MNISQSLQREPNPNSAELPSSQLGQDAQPAKVYNLAVLVHTDNESKVTARAANLAVPDVQGKTIREALSKLVESAKTTIDHQLANAAEIPWIDPPHEPSDAESRFVVPLHL